MRKVTIFGITCLILALVAMPFAACAEPTPPPPAEPTVITPTPAVVVPSPGLPATPTVPVTPTAPTTTTPAAPATPVTPAPAPVIVPAPAGEPVYTVLDPRAYEPPIPFVGLAPRLDTLEGKTVGVANLGGGNSDVVMPGLATALQAAVPGCNVVYWRDPEAKAENFIKSCDAAIIGHDY